MRIMAVWFSVLVVLSLSIGSDQLIEFYCTCVYDNSHVQIYVVMMGVALVMNRLPQHYRISRNIGEHYIWRFAQKVLLAGF